MPVTTERRRAYARNYYLKHQERIRAKSRANHHANREARKCAAKLYREAHRDSIAVKKSLYYRENRARLIQKARDNYWESPEERRLRTRRNHYIYHFGIDADDFNQLWVSQDGKCALCGSPESELDRWNPRTHLLVVDHDHVSGRVRGLLCGTCNRQLGIYEALMGRMGEETIKSYLTTR